MKADDLVAIESWLGPMMARLKPGPRIRLAMKIGQAIRRANTERIAANREPDGASMAPRKKRQTSSGKLRKGGRIRAKMFRKIRLGRNLKVYPKPDGVEVGFTGRMTSIASVHHYGEEDKVGQTKAGRTIRAKYEARRLLGFGTKDMDEIIDSVAKHLKG